MIRPEAHQWNWKPKTRSKDDMKLDKDLEILRKKLGLRKNELTRLALILFYELQDQQWELSKSYHSMKAKLLKSNQEVKGL